MVTTFAEALMGAEADAVCGAGYGERCAERTNTRNGYRRREWDTRAGTIELAIPKLRHGQLLPGLAAGAAPARRGGAGHAWWPRRYLLGVSTRRMEKLVETLGITRLSKSRSARWPRTWTSRWRRSAPGRWTPARTRSWPPTRWCSRSARAAARSTSHALLATGVNADGYREILGLQVTSAEDGAGWLAFFRDLVARGLSGVALVTSDAHPGLVDAIGATLPGAAWQRCRTHYAANLMSATPKTAWAWVKALLHSIYDQPDAASVHAQFDRVLDALTEKLPAVAEHLDDARADILAFTAFPKDDLAADLVEQPAGTAQPGDPPPHRRRRHLPRPRRR